MTPPSPAPDADDPGPEAERLAAIEERLLGGERDDLALGDATDGQVNPDDLDLILLLCQMGAEARERQAAGQEEPLLPTMLGRFTILRLVGSGGFATVHEAVDCRLGRRVALKVARPECLITTSLRRRFVREAELAARLSHPHLVPVHEVGESEGFVYIVEEFCDGGSLAEWLERHPGPMDPRQAARVARALCDGVIEAHAAGICHRDIKPGNVLLSGSGSDPILGDDDSGRGWTVRLGDFGLGKLATEPGDESPLTALTRAGTRLGTPAWMAPEQIDHSLGPVGPAADVHGIGLVLDRMLTGRDRHAGQNEAETMRLVLLAEPDAIAAAGAKLPPDLAAVCLRCLAKEPGRRYASVAALRDDLDRFLAGRPTQARPLSAWQRGLRMVRRRPAVAGGLAAAVAAVAIAGAAWKAVLLSRAETAATLAKMRHRDAAVELRRGFDLLRSGSAAAAIEGLAEASQIDAAVAGSVAGQWLTARSHGEEAMLLDLRANAGGPTAGEPLDIYCLRLSPDGHRLAAGAANGTLWLLDLDLAGRPTGSPRSVAAHDEINGLAFSPDGNLLASAGQDGRVRLWRPADGTLLREVAEEPRAIFGVDFSPTGDRLAWGGAERVLSVEPQDGQGKPVGPAVHWKPFTDAPGVPLEEQSFIQALAFVDAETVVAVCGVEALAINVVVGTVERSFPGHRPVLGTVAVSADRRRIITAGTDREPRMWDAESGVLLTKLPRHVERIHGVTFFDKGASVATGCLDGVIRVFDLDGTERNRLVGHVGRTWDLQGDHRGGILSCGADGTIRRWDPAVTIATAGAHLLDLPGVRILAIGKAAASRCVNVVAVDGTAAAAGARISVVEVPGGHEQQVGTTPVPHLVGAALHPDGDQAIAWGTGPRCFLLGPDGQKDEVVFEGLGAVPDLAAASPVWLPGGWLVLEVEQFRTGLPQPSRLPWLLAMQAGERRARTICRIEGRVRCASVSPSGRLVLGTGSKVMLVPLDAAGKPRADGWQELFDFTGEGLVSTVAWDPEGRRVAAANDRGRAVVLDVVGRDPAQLLTPLATGIQQVAWSPDGMTVISAAGGVVRISDAATGMTLDELEPGWIANTAQLLTWPGDPWSPWLVAAGGLTSGQEVGPPGRDEARMLVMPLGRRWDSAGGFAAHGPP